MQELGSKSNFKPHFSIVEKKNFKKLQTKKSSKINLSFISKNPFEMSRLHLRVIDKFQRGVGKDIFWDIFKHPL